MQWEWLQIENICLIVGLTVMKVDGGKNDYARTISSIKGGLETEVGMR